MISQSDARLRSELRTAGASSAESRLLAALAEEIGRLARSELMRPHRSNRMPRQAARFSPSVVSIGVVGATVVLISLSASILHDEYLDSCMRSKA